MPSARAQKIGRETSELLFEAEFYRLKARSLLIDGPPYERSSAGTILEQALSVARSQGARSMELLIARDLANLWGKQGRRGKARDLLAPVYGWFTEGFDTPDLTEVKALLEALNV